MIAEQAAPTVAAVPTAPPARRTFYARAGHLSFYVGEPKRIIEDGQTKVLDPPLIQFSPTGVSDGEVSWGQYTTSDLAEIAALEGRDDVVGPEEYNKHVTPPAIRVTQLEKSNADLLRELSDRNTLIERLQAQGKLPK
jgi:hypothetical protein